MTSLALALLLVLARGLNIEVVHADSPRWRVASGDIHGAEPIASDAIGCPAGDLFYLGGIAAENSSIELLFSGMYASLLASRRGLSASARRHARALRRYESDRRAA